MTYILAGNSAPIERVKRAVPEDIEAAREQLVGLIDTKRMSYVDPETNKKVETDPVEYVAGLADDVVREQLASHRVNQVLPTYNGESITEVSVPDDKTAFETVQAFQQAWSSHSTENPAWIETPNEAVQALLVAAYTQDGKAPATKMPERWMADKNGNPPAPAWVLSTVANLMPAFLLPALMATLLGMGLFLRTNAGRDFQCAVMGNSGGSGAGTGTGRPADYLAITENATSPALADTTLTGELAGSGLGRALATFAHTAASLTYTLTYTWTSADASARTINKMAVFNASSTGTMVFESLVPSPPTLVSGDSLQITETVDIT